MPIEFNLPIYPVNPAVLETESFIKYLAKEYPLKESHILMVNVTETISKHTQAHCGDCTNWGHAHVKLKSIINVRVGTNTSTPSYYFKTLAHEYSHALQNDRGDVNREDCRSTTRNGGNRYETEADLFSVESVSRYLHIDPMHLIGEIGINSFYKISQNILKEISSEPSASHKIL
jgi:hypothetical protein